MTATATPTSAGDVLRTDATQLRNDPAAESLAISLERLANALRHPNGYVIKAYGAGIRHDLCAATVAEVQRAALREGMLPNSYTIEPFLLLRP